MRLGFALTDNMHDFLGEVHSNTMRLKYTKWYIMRTFDECWILLICKIYPRRFMACLSHYFMTIAPRFAGFFKLKLLIFIA